MKKKKGFDLKEEYKKSWDYLKESRKFIYFIIGIFLVFSLIGYFVPASAELEKIILDFIEELLKQTENMSQFELTKFIFLNNLQSSFFGMFFGFVLGVFPILDSIFNGYLIGFVVERSVDIGGISVLWRLFPHGIFELPAVFISLGMGLRFGSFIFQKNKINSFKKYLYDSFRVFIFVVIPLLTIAAIIEGALVILF